MFAMIFMVPTAMAVPSVDKGQPVYMQADQLGYDQNNAIVVAQGNVEVAQGNTRLFADRITYYQNHQIVRADGNVRVADSSGETYYADKVQLKDDLKEGVIRNFRVRMSDNSQFAAREARRVSETRTTLKKAVYSPCKICEGAAPFWQIKAGKVAIDEEDERVYYKDLQLDLMGIPVAYAPYFFHPAPGAKRKSGFLKPEYSQNSNLGTVIRLPYYANLSPSQDATITPIFTSEEGLVLEGEYRKLFDDGRMTFRGSVTYPDKRDSSGLVTNGREIRGHVFANGNYNFSKHWSAGFDVQRSVDDTYMRKYRYGNYKSLNSRVFVDGVYGRSYASVQGLAFQGLQEDDDPDREPFVVPLAEGYYESDPMWHGSRLFASANTQVVTRDAGDNSRRLSVSSGYKLPHVTSSGHLFDVEAKIRTDVYSVEDHVMPSGATFSGEKLRVIPQASVKWRYPLIRRVEDSSLTIEPTVLAVASSQGNNPDEIPNEDNLIVEYSDADLFNTDRFPGHDTVDDGSRIVYGVRGQWLIDDKRNLQFILGQNVSAEDETPYPYNDDPGEHFSDYIGRVAFRYEPYTLGYRFRLDQRDLQPNSSAVSLGYNKEPVNFNLNYVSLDNDSFLQDREEILSSMAIAISDEWKISGAARRDLLNDAMLYAGAGLVFHNECFTLQTSLSRQFTRDRDVEPDTNLTVRILFKNLNGL